MAPIPISTIRCLLLHALKSSKEWWPVLADLYSACCNILHERQMYSFIIHYSYVCTLYNNIQLYKMADNGSNKNMQYKLCDHSSFNCFKNKSSINNQIENKNFIIEIRHGSQMYATEENETWQACSSTSNIVK